MERISAFMDGESARAETHHAMLRLKQDDECVETWATFHLIGDMMRGDPVLRDGFVARFRANMEHEPTQLAPRRYTSTYRKTMQYALSAAASLSAIGVAVFMFYAYGPVSQQDQIAAAPQIEAPAGPRAEPPARMATTVKQGKVNEYLMAHQEFSPSTAFQGVAPYVRTVSEQRDGDGR